MTAAQVKISTAPPFTVDDRLDADHPCQATELQSQCQLRQLLRMLNAAPAPKSFSCHHAIPQKHATAWMEYLPFFSVLEFRKFPDNLNALFGQAVVMPKSRAGRGALKALQLMFGQDVLPQQRATNLDFTDAGDRSV